MSKNVSVKEGNIARKFRPVDRLNVITDNEQGMWKPESAFKLGTLHVSENGIYIASLNGYAAYSEIDVRVTDKLGSDDPDSYDYISPDPENYPDVWDPDSTDWDETELNDPDEWELPEEFDEGDLDLEEPEFDPYDPEESLDDFDPSDLDTSNIKLEDPKLPKETKLKGIDPDTGLETEVTGIENEDGDMELSTEILPSAIHIVVPPRKRKYKEGDFIDYSGIHVYLLNDHHKLFTCEQYPSGEIPFGELIFPVTVAEGDTPSQTYPDYKDSGTVVVTSVGSISAAIHEAMGFYSGGWDDEGGCIAQIMSDISQYEGTNPAIVSAYNGHGNFEGWSPLSVMVITSIHIGDRINLGRQYVSVAYTTRGKANAGEVMKITDMKVASSNSIAYIGTKDGEVSTLNATPSEGGVQEVPVQWMRSDGEMLEDTFTIEIVAEGEDIGETESSQPDPFVGYADISSNGHFYNINRKKIPQIHYANGYVWQEGISTEYSVEQAASLGLIILVR